MLPQLSLAISSKVDLHLKLFVEHYVGSKDPVAYISYFVLFYIVDWRYCLRVGIQADILYNMDSFF